MLRGREFSAVLTISKLQGGLEYLNSLMSLTAAVKIWQCFVILLNFNLFFIRFFSHFTYFFAVPPGVFGYSLQICQIPVRVWELLGSCRVSLLLQGSGRSKHYIHCCQSFSFPQNDLIEDNKWIAVTFFGILSNSKISIPSRVLVTEVWSLFHGNKFSLCPAISALDSAKWP